MIKKIIAKTLKKLGYTVSRTKDQGLDIKESEFWDVYALCKPYTMTSVERMYALFCSVKYVIDNNIKGDFVECGVWRGGSSLLIAKMLSNRKVVDRKIYMYDTFEGMSEPTQFDVSLKNETAQQQLEDSSKQDQESVWCYASFDEVQNNMKKGDLPMENIRMIKGKVEDTIPNAFHDNDIALLRLDTDWFESTYHELIHLYPKLKTNGVLILDDYGHWEGCRKAVDDYFKEKKINLLLNRIDYTGRIAIKTA